MNRKNLEIFGVVSFYSLTATSSVIVNKYFLKSVSVPLILLELQMVVSSVILITGYFIMKLVDKMETKDGKQQQQQQQKEQDNPSVLEAFKLLWPMVFCNVFGLAFNIICLSKIDAIMHQVTRGITLPMTALLGPLLGNDSSSWRVLLICCAIFSGFVVAVSGDIRSTNLSIFGVVAGLISSFINAYNAQFIKTRFSGRNKFSAIDLVYYNNIFSAILLIPVALLYEGSQLSSINNWGHVSIVAVITGILGVIINYAGFLQIQVTSPITHCVSSAARGIFQVLASNLILREKLTICRTVGTGLSLVASSLFPIVKSYDNEIKKKSYDIIELESIKMNQISTEKSSGKLI